MLKNSIGSVLLLLTLSVSAAVAQKVYTPTEKSAERAAILTALSVPVSKGLKQKITFSVAKLKVKGNWAFIDGLPKNSKGGEPNWKITKYQNFIESGDFEQGLVALLKKTGGKWRVVTYLMNCHDVCYMEWDKQYKAPKEIIED
jgi:hypothetical protein